jgi:hypothetical protein
MTIERLERGGFIVRGTLLPTAIAVAINYVRMGNWLMEKPLAQTRTSTFERLMKRSGIG